MRERAEKLIIDNEQLTIMVSLRDGFEIIFDLFPKETPELLTVDANQDLIITPVCES